MRYYHWDELESTIRQESPLRKQVAGDQLTITRTETARGAHLRWRCYPYETVIIIIEGAWQVEVNGRRVIIGTNQILHLPPHTEHDVRALEHTLALEISARPPSLLIERSEGQASLEDENYLWGV